MCRWYGGYLEGEGLKIRFISKLQTWNCDICHIRQENPQILNWNESIVIILINVFAAKCLEINSTLLNFCSFPGVYCDVVLSLAHEEKSTRCVHKIKTACVEVLVSWSLFCCSSSVIFLSTNSFFYFPHSYSRLCRRRCSILHLCSWNLFVHSDVQLLLTWKNTSMLDYLLIF